MNPHQQYHALNKWAEEISMQEYGSPTHTPALIESCRITWKCTQ